MERVIINTLTFSQLFEQKRYRFFLENFIGKPVPAGYYEGKAPRVPCRYALCVEWEGGQCKRLRDSPVP